MKFIQFLIIFFLVGHTININAQKKPVVKNAATVKLKAPTLKTTFGDFKDSTGITVQQGVDVIGKSLVITDEKNNTYKVIAYQFLYKKQGFVQDEQTEKVSRTTSISSSYFYATPNATGLDKNYTAATAGR